jgi:hypothetical protein
MGSSVMVPVSSATWSTRAEQLCRTRPLISMVQLPQTSSRQPLS